MIIDFTICWEEFIGGLEFWEDSTETTTESSIWLLSFVSDWL
jgi:hypothetical protein